VLVSEEEPPTHVGVLARYVCARCRSPL
jgi:hypothetical protein